jgi:hypothetical protein
MRGLSRHEPRESARATEAHVVPEIVQASTRPTRCRPASEAGICVPQRAAIRPESAGLSDFGGVGAAGRGAKGPAVARCRAGWRGAGRGGAGPAVARGRQWRGAGRGGAGPAVARSRTGWRGAGSGAEPDGVARGRARPTNEAGAGRPVAWLHRRPRMSQMFTPVGQESGLDATGRPKVGNRSPFDAPKGPPGGQDAPCGPIEKPIRPDSRPSGPA